MSPHKVALNSGHREIYGSVYRRCETGDYAQPIQLLVDTGADIKSPGNKRGATMIGMAEGNPKLQELLRQIGG